jgi:hypothetical protein
MGKGCAYDPASICAGDSGELRKLKIDALYIKSLLS